MDYGTIYVTWDLQMSQWTPKSESMRKTESESAFFEKKKSCPGWSANVGQQKTSDGQRWKTAVNNKTRWSTKVNSQIHKSMSTASVESQQ